MDDVVIAIRLLDFGVRQLFVDGEVADRLLGEIKPSNSTNSCAVKQDILFGVS